MKSYLIPKTDPYILEGNTRECGECKRKLRIGDKAYYYHHEDAEEFCSATCYVRYYTRVEPELLKNDEASNG